MNKTITTLCTVASLALVATSCGNGSKNGADADSIVDRATSDSISLYYGMMAGGFINGELNAYARYEGEEYDHKAFMRGVQAVAGSEHDDAYLAGVATGLRLNQDIKEMTKSGVQLNRNTIMTAMREAVLADSIDANKHEAVSQVYQLLMNRVQAAVAARQEARQAESPVAVKNIKTGEAFINKLIETDKNIAKTASGLYYRMEKGGEGILARVNDRVHGNFTLRHTDGTVISEMKDAVMSPGTGMPEGIDEALRMLATGAKATFYVPGALAFGANGMAQMDVEPMEMIIFEAEILDINAAEKAPEAPAK